MLPFEETGGLLEGGPPAFERRPEAFSLEYAAGTEDASARLIEKQQAERSRRFFTAMGLCFLLLLSFAGLKLFSSAQQTQSNMALPPSLSALPADFVFGVSTSAYQIEGGWLAGGKGLSNWDAFSHIPGMIANGDTGDVGIDHFNRFPEDVALMAAAGVKHYHLSLMWSRLLPQGTGEVNPEGVKFYDRLINTLLDHGIQPYVTIWHNDWPLALALYPHPSNALLRPDFPELFEHYARTAFSAFGDRVKHWFTFNEPWCAATINVYGPTDPWTIGHNFILAHARAVALYRNEFRAKQGGQVGIVLNVAHFYPKDPQSIADQQAANRSYDFMLGWYLDPLLSPSNDYPDSMRATLGSRLPQFTEAERALLRGSVDMLGVNYYMPFVSSPGDSKPQQRSLSAESERTPAYYPDLNVTNEYDAAWPRTDTEWGVYAPGIRATLVSIRNRYPNGDTLPIYITENGIALKEETRDEGVADWARIQYLHDHIENVARASTLDRVNVRGYFVWSMFDNLEWFMGYSKRFGLVRVEQPSLERVPKQSLQWYAQVVKTHQSKLGQQGGASGMGGETHAAFNVQSSSDAPRVHMDGEPQVHSDTQLAAQSLPTALPTQPGAEDLQAVQKIAVEPPLAFKQQGPVLRGGGW